jgi:hypothetical protein
MIQKVGLLLVVSSMVAACATTPVPTSAAKNVPLSRVMNSALLERRDGSAQLVIKRDEGLSASACNTRVFVDGAPVAEIGTGEKITLYLPEGDHMLAAMATGICAGGLVEVKATLAKVKTSTFRIGYGSSGEFTLQPTAF